MYRPSAIAEISGSAVRYAVNGIKGVLKSVAILLWRTGTLWSVGYALYTAALFIAGYDPFKGSFSGIFIAGGAVTVILNIAIAISNTAERPFVSAAIGYRHPVWESNAHRRQVYREVLATHSSPDTDIVNGRGIIKKTYGNTTYIDYARPEKKRTSSLREKTSDKTVKSYKKDTSGNRKTAIGNRNENKTKNTSGNRDRDRIVNSPYKTKPKIYMSSIEDRLIYDYPDRFEVYIIEGETKRLDRTEYK